MSFTEPGPDNEAIRELRDSSKRLEKLTEELSASSKRLEHLTSVLIVLTIFLMAVTIVGMLFPPDFPLWERTITLLVIVVVVIAMLLIVPPLKKYR